MTSLSHQNARQLLQTALDTELNPQDRTLLAAHVNSCPDCKSYARQLDTLETSLRRLTRQQWHRHAPRFSAQSIRQRAAQKKTFPFQTGLALKFAAVTALAILLVFALNLGGGQPFGPLPAVVPSAPVTARQTPTPSIRETSTQASQPNCQFATHIVQENETLDSIAARYGVSTTRLMEVNSLQTNPLAPGLALSIPVCVTPTNTSTTTPWLGEASPTPRD
jgi:LysM repeat protein